MKRRIGILTGGGDVPGLNPVIKSVVYRATEVGYDVIGIRRGWEGLTHVRPELGADPDYLRPLDRNNTRTIDRTGGTILLTSTSNPPSTAFGWTGPNSFTSTLQNPTIPGATTANSGTYYVTATVNSCTSSPAAMVDVTVNPTLLSLIHI